MSTTARWIDAVGSPFSLSSKAWALSIPVGVIAAPLAAFPEPNSPSQYVHWLLIGLIAQLPMALVLLGGAALTRKSNYPRITTVIVALCAGAVRGLAIVVLGQAPGAATRILSSALTIAIWLLVIGAALESQARYRREVDELLGVIVSRELQGRLLDESATQTARASSADRITETSEELRAIVSDAGDDHNRTAALLQAAIENRLRPLSHDLWFSPFPVAPIEHGGWGLVRRVLDARIPVLPISVAATVLLAWGSLVLHGVWRGALVGVAIGETYGLVLAVAQVIQNPSSLSVGIRYIGVALLPAATGGVAISLLNLQQLSSLIAVVLGLPVITFAIAAAVTRGADRAEIIRDLHARLAKPDWDRHLGDLVRREVDASSATMLHNGLQPAITAAALQLKLAVALDEPLRAHAALDRASKAIDDLARIGGAENSGQERLMQVAEVWSGIATVTLSLPTLELENREWLLLAEVVNECVANAVRHAKASVIEVVVDVDPLAMVIEIRDNGSEERVGGSDGLGRSWLSSVLASTQAIAELDGQMIHRLTIERTLQPQEEQD